MLEVKLKDGSLMRQWCLVCGGQTDKDYVQARVYENGEDTGYVVCLECLGLSPDDRVALVRKYTQQLRARAADMDAQADDLRTVPSPAEWTAANDAIDETFRADLAKERIALGPPIAF